MINSFKWIEYDIMNNKRTTAKTNERSFKFSIFKLERNITDFFIYFEQEQKKEGVIQQKKKQFRLKI